MPGMSTTSHSLTAGAQLLGGETVNVYLARAVGGTVIASTALSATGTATIAGLDYDTEYVAVGATSTKQVRFRTRPPLSTEERIAVVEEAPLNGPAYGLETDGTDQATNLDELVDLVPADGGKIYLGRGPLSLSAFPNLDSRRSITFVGDGGRSGGAGEGTEIICTATGAGTFISALSSFGITFEDVSIAADGAFTGVLLDASAAGGGLDTQFFSLNRVTVDGGSAQDATGLKLVKAVNGGFREVNFKNLDIGVLGRSVSGDYSVAHEFSKCRFGSIVTAPVKNAGESWTFNAPTVQQRVDGAGVFIARDAGFTANGLTIIGPWMGDSDAGEGTWIDWHGNGLTIVGGEAGNCAYFVDANDASVQGINIQGTYLVGSASGITVGIRFNRGKYHCIKPVYNESSVVTDIEMTARPTVSEVWSRGGLVTPLEFVESSGVAVAAPISNSMKIYADDNGAGKTRLKMRTDNSDNVVFTGA
jgi:hypothetical protein